MGNPQSPCTLAGRQAAFLPCFAKDFIDGGTLHRTLAKPHAVRLGCSDPFCLSLTVKLLLRLRYIGQKLKHDIRNQGSGQVSVLPCIQQWHVQNNDRHLLFLRDDAPLLQDFRIVPAKPVDALDYQGIVRL